MFNLKMTERELMLVRHALIKESVCIRVRIRRVAVKPSMAIPKHMQSAVDGESANCDLIDAMLVKLDARPYSPTPIPQETLDDIDFSQPNYS